MSDGACTPPEATSRAPAGAIASAIAAIAARLGPCIMPSVAVSV